MAERQVGDKVAPIKERDRTRRTIITEMWEERSQPTQDRFIMSKMSPKPASINSPLVRP